MISFVSSLDGVMLLTGALYRAVSKSWWLPGGRHSPRRNGSRRYHKTCTMAYMHRNREWAMLTRYSNPLRVVMWESSSILNSFSKAWKSIITSEMGILSDWYLKISLSSGTKIMRAPFNLTTNGSLVMTSLTFWHSACCTAVPLMKSLADEIVCRCDSESSKLWYLCWMVPQHVGAGWTSAWALVAFCNSCSCALTTWWLWNNLLENFLAVDNKLQHLLEWKTNRICCLYVASLLSLCCHKGIFDKKMNSTRTALLEVERQEHVMQQYASLLTTSKDPVLMVFICLSRTSLQQQRLRRLAT